MLLEIWGGAVIFTVMVLTTYYLLIDTTAWWIIATLPNRNGSKQKARTPPFLINIHHDFINRRRP